MQADRDKSAEKAFDTFQQLDVDNSGESELSTSNLRKSACISVSGSAIAVFSSVYRRVISCICMLTICNL